jgi:fructokinase
MKNIMGMGLVALDIVIEKNTEVKPLLFAGGSCGNVLSILSFLNFKSFPISRLGDNDATDLLLEDLQQWGVHLNFIEREEKGSTPIIIHRILNTPFSEPKHRFEFRNPNNGKWLPSYKPVLAKKVEEITNSLPKCDVFYFDRITRSSIELARFAKNQGALIFFEPSSNKDTKLFNECLELSDVIKFSNQRIKSFKTDYPEINVKLEIETLGKEGLNYRFNSNEWKKINSYKIVNEFDTAGAGDWCSAGIIEKLISDGNDISHIVESEIILALKYGQALGAINCMYSGARGIMYEIEKSNILHMARMTLKQELIPKAFDVNSKVKFKKTKKELPELDMILQ